MCVWMREGSENVYYSSICSKEFISSGGVSLSKMVSSQVESIEVPEVSGVLTAAVASI